MECPHQTIRLLINSIKQKTIGIKSPVKLEKEIVSKIIQRRGSIIFETEIIDEDISYERKE